MEKSEIPSAIIIPTAPVPETTTTATIPAPVNNKDVEKPKLPETNSKRHDKSRRKDAPSTDGILRTLSGYATADKKLDALCKMYVELLEDNKQQQAQLKQNDKRMNVLLKEKEHAQADHSKAVLTRSRLESLCRELQRQNKAIKDESLLKIKEEEEKRKEISGKFQSTLAEITTLMNDINDKNSKLREDNTEITNKFKTVCEQYDVRVQQVEKMSNQMQLETALSDAKLRKAHLEAAAEKETMIKEKQELLLVNAKYQARIDELINSESALRSQISVYTDKYEEFHSALSRSNEVFSGFKEEMDKMSKKIIKLEKETASWKHRWEKSHAALLEMAADKQMRDQEIALSSRQLTQLQKLCRTLTEERAKLMNAAQTSVSGSGEEGSSKSIDNVLEENKKLHETLDSLQALIVEREKLQQIERSAPPITLPPVSTSANTPTPTREDKKKTKKQKNRANTAISNQNGTAKTQRSVTPTVNGVHQPQNGDVSPEITETPKVNDKFDIGGGSVDVATSEKLPELPICDASNIDTPDAVAETPEKVVEVETKVVEVSTVVPAPQPEVAAVSQPEIPAECLSEVAAAPQPEISAQHLPKVAAVSQPEVVPLPEVAAVPQPEVSLVSQPQISVVPQAEVSVVPQPDVSVLPEVEVLVPLPEKDGAQLRKGKEATKKKKK